MALSELTHYGDSTAPATHPCSLVDPVQCLAHGRNTSHCFSLTPGLTDFLAASEAEQYVLLSSPFLLALNPAVPGVAHSCAATLTS